MGKKVSGLFVTFEGGEGVGKTTQIARLAHWLEDEGFKVVVTREPGGTLLANRIRSLLLDPKGKGMAPLAELFLYEAARAQHVQELIRPALAAGAAVICDRFADSSVVYQGVARKLKSQWVASLNGMATGGLKPNRTYYLDLDPRIGLSRVGARGVLDRMEREALAFHQAVRRGYRKLAKEEKKRIVTLDASMSRDALQAEIQSDLRSFLP
jgi:dTMP kinase